MSNLDWRVSPLVDGLWHGRAMGDYTYKNEAGFMFCICAGVCSKNILFRNIFNVETSVVVLLVLIMVVKHSLLVHDVDDFYFIPTYQ